MRSGFFGGLGLVILAVLAFIAWSSLFVVSQTQQALVLRFGNPINVITEPGLYVKAPLIDNVGQGAMQMADKGFSRGWGLGRHVLGSNFFHYIRDPWGSYAEYSCDIDYIPAEIDWESKDHDPQDSFYIWGPTPPDDFARNYEAE